MVKRSSVARRAEDPARRVKYLSCVDKWANRQSSRFGAEFDNGRRKILQFHNFHFINERQLSIIKPSTGRSIL
jgi:hypothetical protein